MAEDLVCVTVVPNESAGEMACSALRTDGIECVSRQTNFAAAAWEGMRGGPHEILVRPVDLERAREILGETG